MANYNFNLSPYENAKGNYLSSKISKNKWGNKFKKLYRPLSLDGKVDFTQGMWNCIGTDVHTFLEDLIELEEGLLYLCDDENFLSRNSYFIFLIEKTPTYTNLLKDGEYIYEILNIGVSISSSENLSKEDHRRKSVFFKRDRNVSSEANAILEPIDSFYVRKEQVGVSKPYNSLNRLDLKDNLGEDYGHVDGIPLLKDGTNFNNIFEFYGKDEDNSLFDREVKLKEIENLFNLTFEKQVKEFIDYSDAYNVSGGGEVAIVFGVDLFISWVHEKISSMSAYILDFDESKAGKELELINHLNLCGTLQQQIGGQAGEISNIWFELKKDVSTPRRGNGKTGYKFEENYKWWEEEQFLEVRKKIKDFKLMFEYILDQEAGESYIKLKDSSLYLSGWKVYYLVSICLSIDTRMRKVSWWKRLLQIVILVVAIFLTVISENPIWLKVLLVSSTILSFAGALSPKAQLFITALSFVYGAYNADISNMSSMEMFSWAIDNIDIVLKMIKMYDDIQLIDELKDKADKNVSVTDQQDRAMEYIYSDAYNQYDNLYSVIYDYNPHYK